jgi:capsid protein
MRYDSNYSASRAAIKDWEYTMQTARDRFSQQFYQPYYELWLEMEILNNKIDAPGYIQAIKKNDIMTIEAYTQCRWIGASAPQIDPLKEVNAIRRMLGDETTPLITYDRALELLNGMDFYQVMMRIDAERRLIPEMEEKENKKTKKEKEDGEED